MSSLLRVFSLLISLLVLLPLGPARAQEYAQEDKLLPSDGEESDFFGSAVSISADGTYALVGAFGDDGSGESSDSAYVYSTPPPPPADGPYVYTLGGPGFDEGMDVGLDAAGNLYLTGQFFGTVAFDPDDTNSDGDLEERTAAGNGSAFLASYTTDGAFRFASVPTGGSSSGRDVTTSASGVSFVTGSFGGTVDFDPGPGTASFSAGAGTDVFVASYDATGAYREGFAFGGDGLNTGNGIAVDAAENSLLTGGFSNTTDFDPSPDTADRTSAGQNDLFMARYLMGGVLPVELGSFEAVTDGGDVLLRWTTASETNNAGFDVQRRTDGSPWQSLTFIEGHGSTT